MLNSAPFCSLPTKLTRFVYIACDISDSSAYLTNG